MASSNGNEHTGHRKRLKKKFIENGLDVFELHEALELYLFYAIPRKDTNPLAHRLLDKYGSIGAVCDAPIDELEREFGLLKKSEIFARDMRILDDDDPYDANAIQMTDKIVTQFY